MDKIYLEITNICNLSCSFCHGTKRPPKKLSRDEFDVLSDKLIGKTKTLYFHLMGEPLLHEDLPYFVSEARRKGFLPVITTNGTLLDKAGDALIEAKPSRIAISLQSYEGNDKQSEQKLKNYLDKVCTFAKKAAPEITIVLRLWNQGGRESSNDAIIKYLHQIYEGEWKAQRTGFTIGEKTYLDFDKTFEWPDVKCEEHDGEYFCYGLRNQIGVLVDGTVVPCCLDADGSIPLGNLFENDLDTILKSPRAQALYNGFSMHTPVEELCKHCGFAADTKHFHGTKNSAYAK